uniref:Uncharacterized protein n=1 Tax=Anguilla anguilla TaxID=7936 RepID=A0A0E9UFF6_ANGAN
MPYAMQFPVLNFTKAFYEELQMYGTNRK